MSKLLILIIFSFLILSCSKNIFSNKEQYIKFKNSGRHISISLKINDYNEGNFYFDTGSPWLIIDSTFYKNQEMFFNHYTQSENKGVGNNQIKMLRVLDTIKFSANNNKFTSKFNMINNLKKNLGNDIDGIVGSLNFGNTPFEVNHKKHKIIINPNITTNYQEVDIKFDGYYMYLPIELKLNNQSTIQGNFIIDTGASSTTLTSEFANIKDIHNSEKATYRSNGGVSGIHIGYSLFASDLKINKFKLTDKLLHVSKDSIGALSKNNNYIGIIGNDILNDFDIIYHPTHYKIWMKPNKNLKVPSKNSFKSFILIETDDVNKGWIVGSIYEENNDAYKKGLRHQDEIVEINDKSIKKINLEDFTRKLKPNQKLKLKVKRQNNYFEINIYLNPFLKINN